MNTQQKRQLIILFLTLLMVMVGFGIVLPLMPFYAESMGASATHLGLLFATYSLMQFLFSPLWGRYSDRVGRRPVLILGLTGMALSFVLFGLAQALWMLYAARVLGGLLSSAVLPAAMAYVADSTAEGQRGHGMALMGAAMGLGMIFGPAIGGFLGEFSPALPFFVAAGLALLVAGFAASFLPESLGSQRKSYGPGEGSAHGQLLRALRSPAGLILILGFLSQLAFAGFFGTFALFAEAKLGFGESQMGALFVAMGIVGVLVQGMIVGRMIARWGEARVIQMGLVLSGIGFLSMLLAYDLTSLIALTGIMGLGSALLGPAISALVSKRTLPEQQGTIMGVLNSYHSLGRIVGPLLGGVVFDALGYQYPYVMAGVLFFLIWLGSGALLGPQIKTPVEAVRRRWKPRLAFILVLVILASLGAGLVLREQLRFTLNNTGPEEIIQSTTPQTQNSQSEASKAPPIETPVHESAPPVVLKEEAGRLVFEARGQKLGEESYQLKRLPSGEYQLSSTGYFSFKVLFVPTKFEYTQEILLSADLKPLSFSLEMKGPLGFGSQSVMMKIAGQKAFVTSGQQQSEIEIPTGRFVLLGMFSSYTLMPKLMTGQTQDHFTVLIIRGFGGPRGQSRDSDRAPAPPFSIEIVKLESVKVRAGGSEQEVEQYVLRMGNPSDSSKPSRGLRLLVADGELIGLIGPPREASRGPFKVYRADLFPNGFEVVQTEEER